MSFFQTSFQSLVVGGLCLLTTSVHAYDYSLLPPMNGQPSDFAERRAGKEVNAFIKIGVTDEGIYRVTYSSLTNAGVAASNLVGFMMRLYYRTQEVAILVSSSNQWTASDYFLFPGVGFDGYYSMTNIYWLGFGPGGKRMANLAGIPVNGLSPVTSSRKTVVHHVDSFYRELVPPYDDSWDHWSDIGIPYSPAQTITLATDRAVTNEAPMFQAVMIGYTLNDAVFPDHVTQIRVNGSSIGLFPYDGQASVALTTNFPSTILQATNSVSFQQTVDANDQALLERFSITYSRTLYQNGGALFFDGRPGTNNYLVSGFAASNNLTTFDISDPANATFFTSPQPTNMGGGIYGEQFSGFSSSTSRYAVVSTTAIKDVGFIQKMFFRDLALTNRQADYVVICPYEFRQQVYRLLARRYAQGLSVAVVPLPDLYNEFSYGVADASAIKQFIGYAFHHWRTPPKYILMAGNGIYDPRHILSSWSNADIIPVHLGEGYLAWSPLDGWYAAVNGADNVPDVALGRIPVQNATDLKNVVDKIVAFEANLNDDWWRSQAVLASDNSEVGLDFIGASQYTYSNDFMPNGVTNTFRTYLQPAQQRQAIKDYINGGVFLVNYYGHGALNQWATGPTILDSTDVTNLNNDPYFPIVTMLTCANGWFSGISETCFATGFLKGASRGAAACLAASSLSTLPESQALAHGFYATLLANRVPRIGDALLPAYAELYRQSGNTRELLFFELFGDPAMIVNP